MFGAVTAWISKYVLLGSAIALGVSLLAFGVESHRLKISKSETIEVRNAWTLDRAQATAAALKQTAEFRATEQAWQIKLSKAQYEADSKITKARADAAIADASAGRLQQRVAALIAQARAAAANPSASASSPSAQDPIGMLANVLRSADDRARLLADYADQARIAGQACEQSYGALTEP